MSRLKKVIDLNERPTRKLVTGIDETNRFDFDEELLPEDSRDPDEAGGRYKVEAIWDDELPLSTSTDMNQRSFLLKWKGYDTPTWEPLSNLSCGGLPFDYLRQKKRENRLKWCGWQMGVRSHITGMNNIVSRRTSE